MFSGPLRAGLIEANCWDLIVCAPMRSFPAPCGPASLKRRQAPSQGGTWPHVFSGPLRAGLIEAGRHSIG